MKKLLLTGLVGLGLIVGANASEQRDTTINIYGVSAKTDKNQNSSGGLGIMFDSEAIKVKLEKTSDFIKGGAVLKFNPISEKWYIKVGANTINQKMYAVDNSTAKVNQYSGALAVGYMVDNDLYVELGSSLTKLYGKTLGLDYEIVDETTKIAYFEVAKRWNGSFGVLDTTANVGKVIHEFNQNENSYGLGVDYYQTTDTKIGYKYQTEKNNISNNYSVHYNYLFVEYTDKISSDTYQVNAGVKFAFTNLFDFSTYKSPKNIIPHLSELHRFEDISFSNNMELQSNAGVQLTSEAIERIEAQKEADRLEAERLAQEEADRLEAERLAQEEADRLEAERLAQEEADRLAQEELQNLTAPVLSSTTQTFTTTSGTPLTLVTVTANDAVDGAITVVQSGDTVNFNSVGTYNVVYTATDSSSNISTITHTYVVNAAPVVNQAPTASNASADVAFGETVTYNLASHIADNEDADNLLTIIVVTSPTKGSLSWSGTSFTFTATPASGVFGNDSFTYKVQDTGGSFSTVQTVTITNISEDYNL